MKFATIVARNLLIAARRRRPVRGLAAAAVASSSPPLYVDASSLFWPASRDCRSFTTGSSGDGDDNDRNRDWVPPDRPLVGDKGRSDLYKTEDKKVMESLEEEIKGLEQNEHPDQKETQQEASSSSKPSASSPENMDWLQTRRRMLAADGVGDLTVKTHTLLSQEEIVSYLKSMGGQDVVVMHDKHGRFGGDGIVIVTSIHTQLVRMAQNLRKHLRARLLHEKEVVGAILGIDGDVDYSDETWLALDCGNYVIHFQDEKTRKHVDIESVWSGKDGIHLVNFDDDDAVDEYILKHPVPDGYGARRSADFAEVDIKNLKKTRWTKKRRK